MLSWAVESLIADGRGMSDTYRGVTSKRLAKAIHGTAHAENEAAGGKA
jgi:hypothetical protein